jgi:ribonuclease BN (tRNA processing enzyme)
MEVGMRHSRRHFLAGAASLALIQGGWARRAWSQPRKDTRLILLGTKGGPRVGGPRRNPSTLLLINDVPYVIDCGTSTSQQLLAAGVTLNRLRYVFLTHMHSDHMLEYGPLVYNAWIAGLRTRVDAYGPPPLKSATQAFWEYVKFDIDTRIEDEGRPDPRPLLVVSELDTPRVVLDNADVKVTSATVVHPPITHAYAYRFDTKDRSVVISGDTNYSSALVALAKGADVLVHEVIYLPAIDRLLANIPNAVTLRKHLVDSHTVPEDVGRVAAQAQVKTLVLSHFVPGDDPTITDEMWTEGVRKHYQGPIVVGRDLMEI